MSHDNERKKCQCGKYPKKYEHVCSKDKHCPNCLVEFENTLLIFCPSCKNRLKYNVNTPPSEVSTFDSALDEILKYSKSDFCPGCGLTKEGLRIIREETKREVLQDMRQYTHYGVDFLDRVEQYAVEKGINLSEQ